MTHRPHLLSLPLSLSLLLVACQSKVATPGSGGAGGKAPDVDLSLGGTFLPLSSFASASTSSQRRTLHDNEVSAKDGALELRYQQRSGPPTFLAMRAQYEVPLTGANRAAVAHGLTVTRRYETVEGASLEGKTIPLGSLVRVRVSVKSDTPRHYVAVDDKLPAGLEPMNAGLATTEKVSLDEVNPEVTAGLNALSYSETRDARVAFYADELPAGIFEWVYVARATTPGHFLRPPASAEAMYEPKVSGHSELVDVEVKAPVSKFTEWVRAGQAGAEVRTTLDATLQQELEAMVRDHVHALAPQGVTNASVVVLDNASCEVLAMVGSADYWDPRDGSVNGALARRQPGSTLKPFTYALAYEHGHGPNSVAADVETQYGNVGGALFKPKNFSKEFVGPVLFHEALGRSLNVPAIRVAALFGAEELLERLHDAGFASLEQPASHYGLGLTLGNGEVTLVELSGAYAMLARGGRSCVPHGLLEQPLAPERQVYTAQVTGLITAALSDEGTRLRAFGPGNALMLPFPVAVKTGTSTNWRDNWAVGFTERYTVAVWAGDFDNRPMEQLAAASGAGPLFHRVMSRVATRDGQARPTGFAPVRNTVEVTVCASSGLLATADCPEHRRLQLPKDQLPTRSCQEHRKLELDARDGLLAGPGCPKRFVTSRVFEVLPPAYGAWQREHPRRAPPAQYSPFCPQRGVVPGEVVVRWPRNGDVFLVDPGYARRTQTLPRLAEAEGVGQTVRWRVDGEVVAEGPELTPQWALVPGRHRVWAEAGSKRSAPVEFEVR